MSHSKYHAKGQSYYVEHSGLAKRYLRVCSLCGQVGYDPIIHDGNHNPHLVK